MTTTMDDQKPGVVLIGAGAVGSVLAQRLSRQGYPIEAIISRTEARARHLADHVGAPLASASLYDLPFRLSLVLCCVPDDAIGEVAEVLSTVQPDWTGVTVAHVSGALTSSALDSLAACGAATLSLHPLQTFTRRSTPDAFEGIYIGLEGEEDALLLGLRITADLGARPLILTPEAKTRYHLAASMASNFFVTLMALAAEVLATIDIDRRHSAAILRPLVEGTWRNLAHSLPEDALTGPIARGDSITVAEHTAALARHLPHLTPVYAALGAEAVRLAVRSGRLDPAVAQQVLDVLHAALEPDKDTLY